VLCIGAKFFIEQSIYLPGRRFDTVLPYRQQDRREQFEFGVDGLEVTGHRFTVVPFENAESCNSTAAISVPGGTSNSTHTFALKPE
jgi:hypothetical protein